MNRRRLIPLLKALGTNGAMCCAVASAALFLGSSPAHSTFIVATNPSGDQFFNGDANKNVSSFTARWVDSIPDLVTVTGR